MKRFMRRHEISMSGRIFALASSVHLYRFISICLYLFAKCLPLFVWPLINLYCVAGGSHWVFIWNNNEFTHKDCDRASIEWWSHLWHSLFIAANSETLERAGLSREKKTRIEASFETQSESDWIVSLVLWMNCTVDGVDLCSELQKWNSHSFVKLKADRNSKAFQLIFNRKETSIIHDVENDWKYSR